MSIAHVITGGFGNGTFAGEIRQIMLDGFFDSAVPPVFIETIPNLVAGFDTGSHEFDLSDKAAGETSYSIAPALETGWSFNTDTGVLTVDTDDAGTFGPYTVTYTNSAGDTDSNAFHVQVLAVGGKSTTRMGMSLGISLG
jgi:hypothetical protein